MIRLCVHYCKRKGRIKSHRASYYLNTSWESLPKANERLTGTINSVLLDVLAVHPPLHLLKGILLLTKLNRVVFSNGWLRISGACVSRLPERRLSSHVRDGSYLRENRSACHRAGHVASGLPFSSIAYLPYPGYGLVG